MASPSRQEGENARITINYVPKVSILERMKNHRVDDVTAAMFKMCM